MTRRKSRPLLPHEIFSNLQSSEEDAGHGSSSSSSAHEGSQQQHSSSQGTSFPSQSTVQSLHTAQQDKVLVDPVVNELATLSGARSVGGNTMVRGSENGFEDSVKPTDMSASFNDRADNDQPSITSLIRSLSQTASTRRRPGYLANRRSASFVIHDESRNGLSPSLLASSLPSIGPVKVASNASGSPQTFKRTSSHVRLSMSLDGKAEVTTRTGNTPSPPRSQPVPTAINPVTRSNTSLQRSYSDVESGNKSLSDVVPVPYTRRSITGRSRDARTWEFYCDSDARNALTEQAEREESGSATAAIELIRSHCNNTKVMTSNPNKRNAHSQKPNATKRFKADAQGTVKPRLARAAFSTARLQTGNSTELTQKVGEKSKGASQPAIWQDYEGDSDKENWEPGTQSSNPRRRTPRHSHHAARILEDNLRVPSQSSSLDAVMNRESATSRRSTTKSSSSEEKENSGPEVDDEIAAFMGESGPREVEDLDCVQNLLSLSQAAWQ